MTVCGRRVGGTLHRRNQVNRHRKLDERVEASPWPAVQGHELDPACWRGRGTGPGGVVVPRDGAVEKNALKPQKQQWCIPKVSAEFVAHMEDGTCTINRWSASTRVPPSCWPIPVRPCQRPRDAPGGRTTSTCGLAPATCSLPVNPRWSYHQATYHAGAHRMRWPSLPRRPSGASSLGQPEYPSGLAVRDLLVVICHCGCQLRRR